MMRKNELTSGEKDTRRSKETTAITTANGKAESTEEATVYINDLDVFVTMMLLEDSKQCYLFVFITRRNGLLFRMEKGESPSLIRYGKVIKVQV